VLRRCLEGGGDLGVLTADREGTMPRPLLDICGHRGKSPMPVPPLRLRGARIGRRGEQRMFEGDSSVAQPDDPSELGRGQELRVVRSDNIADELEARVRGCRGHEQGVGGRLVKSLQAATKKLMEGGREWNGLT
jgi:hypothetical protein